MKFSFVNISKDDKHIIKKLKIIYYIYKVKALKNHGEKHFNIKYILNFLYSSLDCEDDEFIVMYCDNKMIGFADISTDSKDRMLDITYEYGTVKDFYILPKYRRKRYGRKLNTYIENCFINKDIDTVLLYPDPVLGIDFWKAMGYVYTGLHDSKDKWNVYIKTLSETENAINIKKAIGKLL